MMKRILLCACVSVFMSGYAGAQDDSPDLGSLGEPWWTVRFEPVVHYASPGGDVRLPSSGALGDRIGMSDLNLDSPRLSPMGRFMATRGKWRFAVSGVGFRMSDQGATAAEAGRIGGAPFAAGDRLVSDLSYQTFEITASYRLLHHRREGADPGAIGIEFGVDVLAGMRFHRVDLDVLVSPAMLPPPGVPNSAGADEIFAAPIVGSRFELDFSRTFGIDIESTVGGFSTGGRTSVSFSIEAGFVYRPTPALGVRLGYHMMVFDLSSGSGAGEFKWEGSVAGLYWGAQLSF